jgi:hypothetical protein
MPIKNMPGESQEVTLRRWRVVEIEAPDGTRSRHVYGHDVKSDRGRASSPIKEFNLDAMTATTRSGSKYKLAGLPGNSRVGKDAWSSWLRDNKVVSEADVTNEYLNVDQISTAKLVKFNSAVD